MGNPSQRSIILETGAVGADEANALKTAKITVRDAAWVEIWVQVNAAASLTGISVLAAPEAFQGKASRDWKPMPSMALTSGAVAMSKLDAQYLKTDWFAADGRGFVLRVPAMGVHMGVGLHEVTGGAGNGVGSDVQVSVFLREGV